MAQGRIESPVTQNTPSPRLRHCSNNILRYFVPNIVFLTDLSPVISVISIANIIINDIIHMEQCKQKCILSALLILKFHKHNSGTACQRAIIPLKINKNVLESTKILKIYYCIYIQNKWQKDNFNKFEITLWQSTKVASFFNDTSK